MADIDSASLDVDRINRDDVDKVIIRCLDSKAVFAMEALIKKTKDEKDSVGGVVNCICRNLPVLTW